MSEILLKFVGFFIKHSADSTPHVALALGVERGIAAISRRMPSAKDNFRDPTVDGLRMKDGCKTAIGIDGELTLDESAAYKSVSDIQFQGVKSPEPSPPTSS